MSGHMSAQEIVRLAAQAGAKAPSVLNTQPWRFSGDGQQVSVYADAERRLATADPAGREMLVSCGAAVFNIRLALRHLGYTTAVALLPEPGQPALVARVRWDRMLPETAAERALYDQIPVRHTHRGGFAPGPFPSALTTSLHQEALREGAVLEIVANEQRRAALAAVVETGENALRLDPGRTLEQTRWTLAPGSLRHDGVPPTAYPARPGHTDPPFPSRDFAHGHGWGIPPHGPDPLLRSPGMVSLLTTAGDTATDWVCAGQALQRVLLTASAAGAVTALHSQPLEFPELREFVHRHLAGGYPQLVLRCGFTSLQTASIRRPLADVLVPEGGAPAGAGRVSP